MMERRSTVSGIEMRWLEAGEGKPVVLVHGIPTSPELWRYVIPRLDGCRGLAWEMVGYGESRSTGLQHDISIGRQADHLAAWLEHLDAGPAVLVGHDLGGGAVQILAVRRPELVDGIVLTNSIGYDSWPIPSVKAMRAMRGVIERLPPKALIAALRTMFVRGHDDRAMAAEAARLHLARYETREGPAAFARQIGALDVQDTLDVQDRLPDLRVPAAVVWGTADGFQKIRYGERFARDLRAPLHAIPGGKHFVPEDHPEELAQAILDVVRPS